MEDVTYYSESLNVFCLQNNVVGASAYQSNVDICGS